jgi:hypothetical protein
VSSSRPKSRNLPVTAFWTDTPLGEMTRAQWESLCDGCGRCCLHKLQDEDSGATFYTNVACRLLDVDRCRCTRYRDRHRWVADCVRLTRGNLAMLEWMPSTCAYRLLYEGKPLPRWHPLVSGDPESVHRAGISVRGKVVDERAVDPGDLHEHVIEWVRNREDFAGAG